MNIRSERSRRRNRPPRLRGLSLNRLLPNMLTMLALCAGVTAMRFAIQGRFEAAVVSIMVAAVAGVKPRGRRDGARDTGRHGSSTGGNLDYAGEQECELNHVPASGTRRPR